PLRRSHVDKTILLLKIEDRYVPIVESAIVILSRDEPPPKIHLPPQQHPRAAPQSTGLPH
ncbi:Uncharacterized protein FKW44_021265, partial [Caligus rogercresseyi]